MNKGLIKIIRVVILLSIFGCGSHQREPIENVKAAENGDVYYGGVFHLNEVEAFRNLYPLSITEVTSSRIANQIYEGLIKFDPSDLSIIPGLATSWDVNEDGTLFTFYLREGVYFHKDKCFGESATRLFTAKDVKYCLDRLCEPHVLNKGFWVFQNKVLGANEYYASVRDGNPLEGGVSGIRVLGDHTIEIELERPFAGFINLLGTSFTYIYPREAFETYGMDMRAYTVGTGPFLLDQVVDDEAVILMRNENYWGKDQYGNSLPYLDAIKFTFFKDQKTEILEFRKGNLDMIYKFPVEYRRYIVDAKDNLLAGYQDYILQVTPSISTHYYGYMHTDTIFGDIRVRKAFNYAIDRERLVTYTLKGEGIPAFHGFLPPAFPNVPIDQIKGYDFDPDKAAFYLSEAGFPEGKGFPNIRLQLNSGGTRNIQIAEAIQRMLADNLNVNIRLDLMPFAQHLENIELGRADFWRSGWIASYPEPEYFLNLFHSIHVPVDPLQHAYLNSFRYKSAKFDSIFELALQTPDPVKRNELYAMADQQAMDDAVMMPLFYGKDYRLLQKYVRNFPINPMELRDFSTVYFDPEAIDIDPELHAFEKNLK